MAINRILLNIQLLGGQALILLAKTNTIINISCQDW